MLKIKYRVALKNVETRNFKVKVLIRKMSITTLAQIENGDFTPLNHYLLLVQNFILVSIFFRATLNLFSTFMKCCCCFFLFLLLLFYKQFPTFFFTIFAMTIDLCMSFQFHQLFFTTTSQSQLPTFQHSYSLINDSF